MLSIQQVGKEILTNNPGKFYVFNGNEYGIKEKYIEHLKQFYGDYAEYETVKSVLNLFKKKRIIPLPPKLYIVRYDEEFISQLSQKTEDEIRITKISGTVICLYSIKKHCDKTAKYLPAYTVEIGEVDKRFIIKYLKSDFPQLNEIVINEIAKFSENYSHAVNVARSICEYGENADRISNEDFGKVFDWNHTVNEKQFAEGIASRNFEYCINTMETYQGEKDTLIYTILSTCLELEKCLMKKSSALKKYADRWNIEDIYNLFNQAYCKLKELRTITADSYGALIYLISLLQFTKIPTVKEMGIAEN